MLYVATNRLLVRRSSGLALFALGAWFFGNARRRTCTTASTTWLRPVRPALYDERRQLPDRAVAVRAGRRRAARHAASAQALLSLPGGAPILPAAHTDLIYAVIVNELGLVGACGVLLVYLLFIERGFKIAMLARDSFSKLLATGLTAVFALQVFVIVGGVTKVIPLTGVTLPFVSYGGSSIVANFILLALLLQISDRARRDRGAE